MKILPQPQKSENISGNFTISDNSKIFCDGAFVAQAKRLADMVQDSCGVTLQFTDVIEEAQIIFVRDEQYGKEGYVLMISEGVATVTCATAAGCFYAVQSLRQIFHLDTQQEQISCANCYVEDSPRFSHRGLTVDISRHFFGVDTLMQIVDLMSQVKLNKLHLHLSDDQGFRVQIDKYPKLHEISSNRSGSEILKEDGQSYVDDVAHGGYLTKEDICALVEYATAHSVEIIPEINIPGHLVAILAAYPEFSCMGHNVEVRKAWGTSKDILCAGNDATYDFVKNVLDEICELFPSEYIHLGGDVAPKDRWCNCKQCRERMAELKIDDYDEFQTYMIEVFRAHLEQKGKKVICWNDGLTRSSSNEIVAQVWTPKKRSIKKQIRRGRNVIISTRNRLYFAPHEHAFVNKTLLLNPYRGVKRSARSKVLGVEGTLFTEYIDTEDKLFYQLLPCMDALAEVAWGNGKKGFYKRLNQRLALYDKLKLNYNKQIFPQK